MFFGLSFAVGYRPTCNPYINNIFQFMRFVKFEYA